MADADYDRGFLAGQESLDRDLDACKDKLEAGEAKLAEVEKERDEAVRAHKASAELWWKQRASMDRARELAEKARPLRDATGAKDDFAEIARLLSGDE